MQIYTNHRKQIVKGTIEKSASQLGFPVELIEEPALLLRQGQDQRVGVPFGRVRGQGRRQGSVRCRFWGGGRKVWPKVATTEWTTRVATELNVPLETFRTERMTAGYKMWIPLLI